MYARSAMPPALAALAHQQAGVFSRGQALKAGASEQVIRGFVRDGRCRKIDPGVYAVGDATWLQLAWAGILIGGTTAVLGRSSAAFLHRFVPSPNTPIEIYVSRGTRIHRDARWRFIRATREGSGSPPRTNPARTVLDLCDTTPDNVAALVADAIARRGIRPARFRHELENIVRQPNRRLVEAALFDVETGAESVLEIRYLRDVERRHRLPTARRQASPTGRFRCDVWYEKYGVIVELDGRAYHHGTGALTDMDRDNVHILSDIHTLRFGWRHVASEPCRVAATVTEALRQGGWAGNLRRCRRCLS